MSVATSLHELTRDHGEHRVGISRIPGLDGLRALAVVAVLLFHLRLEMASGGFLGVSLFFTLSGYLITQLLITEHQQYGRVSLGQFWIRRLRRLMPGALFALVMIVVVALVLEVYRSPSVHGDVWAALGYVANWRFMTAGSSYADLFSATPSPVLHFWSLAIEEQFYFVFPLFMAGLLTMRRRWVVPAGLMVVWVASFSLSFVGFADDVIYYGTHTRAVELLTGSLLAFVLPTTALSTMVLAETKIVWRRLVGAVMIAALIVFLMLMITAETTDRWLYQGGFALFSFVSALLVIGVQRPGPLRWLAERRPIVAIGQLSYGLYLFHWPIFILIDTERTGLSGLPLIALRLGLTLAMAQLSSHFVEMPIRQRRFARSRAKGALVLVSVSGIVAGAVFFIPQTSRSVLAGLDAPDTVVEFGAATVEPVLRLAILGSHPATVLDTRRAVGAMRSVEIVDAVDTRCPTMGSISVVNGCASVAQRLAELESEDKIDVIVIGIGESERKWIIDEMSRTGLDIFQQANRYANEILDALPSGEIVFLDYGTGDQLANELADAGMENARVTALRRPADAVLLETLQVIVDKIEGEDRRQRLMVIGDSSSFGVSAAIDAVAGDHFNVLWSGRRNCPLVDVERLRWWEGVEFDMESCPTLNPEWRELIDVFEPRYIMIVVAIPEQAEQMYPGDSAWHLVGDPVFTATHDAFMAEFMSLLDERDIELFFFTSPRVFGGALGGAPFSRDERVASWNAEISRWSQQWPNITLVDWAGILERQESPAGSLRSDGVHLEQSALNRIIAAEVLPILEAAVHSPQSSGIG